LGGSTPPPPPPGKFRRPSKIVPNRTRLWKLSTVAEFRTPTPQDVRKKVNKILKLPPVRNCFTLAMTNKLVVIVNCLKVPNIKKILLYEMKFLVANYSCLQNPWLGGYRPQIPVLSVLCPQLNLLNPPEQNSRVRHCCGKKVEFVNVNLLNARLNPICHLLALLAHLIFHVSRIRVKSDGILCSHWALKE